MMLVRSPCARNLLINPFVPGRAAIFTIQAVIHVVFVQIKDRGAGQLFQFAPEEPPLHLVALAVFYEFF